MRRRYYYRGPAGFYHAYNRAARGMRLFTDDADRSYFFRLLGLSAAKHGVTVLAWCLMDTHFHLALDAAGSSISRMMQTLQKTYAKYYNEKTGYTGSLFQGRFCSTYIRDLPLLAYVVRYIHANCRDRGVAPERYMWSSYRSYVNAAGRPPWFAPAPVLDHLGGIPAFELYTAEVPPRRKRRRRQREEDAAQEALVDHFAERVRRRLDGQAEELGPLSVNVAICWVALRTFGARPRVLAAALGFSSGGTVNALVRRFEERLEGRPELRALLEGC